jgi:hypothetical protein
MSVHTDRAQLRFEFAALVLVMALFHAGCYRPYPPEKPKGVPSEAVWAGGMDGGGWVYCSTTSPRYNECTIFDEQGRTRGPSRYAMKNTGLPAKPEELKYTYLTGKAIGLEGGLELVIIDEKK